MSNLLARVDRLMATWTAPKRSTVWLYLGESGPTRIQHDAKKRSSMIFVGRAECNPFPRGAFAVLVRGQTFPDAATMARPDAMGDTIRARPHISVEQVDALRDAIEEDLPDDLAAIVRAAKTLVVCGRPNAAKAT